MRSHLPGEERMNMKNIRNGIGQNDGKTLSQKIGEGGGDMTAAKVMGDSPQAIEKREEGSMLMTAQKGDPGQGRRTMAPRERGDRVQKTIEEM